MIEQFAEQIKPLLNFSIVRRTRRNHALEHATIHVLTRRSRRTRLSGRSTDSGFVILGHVETSELESAVEEALHRLRQGEANLAVHPNCGTNLVTAAGMATLAGWIGLRSTNQRLSLDRISWTMLLVMLALIISQPLGMSLQKHITTEGRPGDLELVNITRQQVNWPFFDKPVTLHTVNTCRG